MLALLGRHGPELLGIARRYSLGPEDAEDAYQRSLEILLTKGPRGDEARLLPWLKTVVKHEAISQRRKGARVLPTDHELLDRSLVAGPGAEERVERYEQLRRGAEAIGALKPQEARCLRLRAAGLSYTQIARETGYSPTKVNRCLTEGRAAFRDRVSNIESGAECRRLEPLISALADRRASIKETVTLRRHLRSCLACQATLREFRAAPSRVAALLPSLALAPGGGLREALARFGEGLSTVKQQAGALIGRTGSAEPAGQFVAAGGLRGSGPMAVAAVSCALAGGGAYCAVEGLPAPVDAVAGSDADRAERAPERRPEEPARRSAAIEAPARETKGIDEAAGGAGAATRANTEQAPRVSEPEAPPADPDEFGFDGAGAARQQTAPPPAASEFEGAPSGAPSNGSSEGSPEEFGP